MTQEERRLEIKAAIARKTPEEKKESLLRLLDEMADRAADALKAAMITAHFRLSEARYSDEQNQWKT